MFLIMYSDGNYGYVLPCMWVEQLEDDVFGLLEDGVVD